MTCLASRCYSPLIDLMCLGQVQRWRRTVEIKSGNTSHTNRTEGDKGGSFDSVGLEFKGCEFEELASNLKLVLWLTEADLLDCSILKVEIEVEDYGRLPIFSFLLNIHHGCRLSGIGQEYMCSIQGYIFKDYFKIWPGLQNSWEVMTFRNVFHGPVLVRTFSSDFLITHSWRETCILRDRTSSRKIYL